MAAIGEIAIGDCGQGHSREPLRRGTKGERGAQRALGTGAVAHTDPVAKPTRERFERDVSAERLGVGPRRLSLAVIGHGGNAVERREITVIVIQHRKEVRERHKGGEPDPQLWRWVAP
jgi:hypothetical protein